MKIKKILLALIILTLSLSLMGCPKVQNQPPEFKQVVDGEMQDINKIEYQQKVRTEFNPQEMVDNIIENQNLRAIDYIQEGVIIGKNRKYVDISDRIDCISFYLLWTEGDDANFDGVVNDDDEPYYGMPKTDADGNKLYNDQLIQLVEFVFGAGTTMPFTLVVTDDDGAQTTLDGTIKIIE